MNEIFYKISQKNNYINTTEIKKMYYSLLKVVIEELRTGGSIKLPDLGEFRILAYKPRVIGNVNTGLRQQLDSVKVIKFKPCHKLRDYIKKID